MNNQVLEQQLIMNNHSKESTHSQGFNKLGRKDRSILIRFHEEENIKHKIKIKMKAQLPEINSSVVNCGSNGGYWRWLWWRDNLDLTRKRILHLPEVVVHVDGKSPEKHKIKKENKTSESTRVAALVGVGLVGFWTGEWVGDGGDFEFKKMVVMEVL